MGVPALRLVAQQAAQLEDDPAAHSALVAYAEENRTMLERQVVHRDSDALVLARALADVVRTAGGRPSSVVQVLAGVRHEAKALRKGAGAVRGRAEDEEKNLKTPPAETRGVAATDALARAADTFRKRAAKPRGRGGTARVGNDRGDLIHASHLAATASQSLDLLLEAFERTLLAGAKAEERLLGRAYDLLIRTRREVRALHAALQAAEEGLDPPTEGETEDAG